MNSTSPSLSVDSSAARSPGPLDGRAAGDPQRRAELGGDDHGQGGLAEAGRPGQQHVVRRPAAPQRALQHQRELLADPLLADELPSRLGRSAASIARSSRVGQRRHDAFVARCRRRATAAPASRRPRRARSRSRAQRRAARRAARPRRRRRSRSPPSAASSSGSTARDRLSASRACQPRLIRPARTCRARRGGRRAGRPAPARRRGLAGRAEPSLSSSTIRCAPLRPIPGTHQRREVLGRDRPAQRVRACARPAWPAPAAGRRRSRSAAARRRSARRRWRSRTGSARPPAPPARWRPWPARRGRSPARVPGVHCTAARRRRPR